MQATTQCLYLEFAPGSGPFIPSLALYHTPFSTYDEKGNNKKSHLMVGNQRVFEFPDADPQEWQANLPQIRQNLKDLIKDETLLSADAT